MDNPEKTIEKRKNDKNKICSIELSLLLTICQDTIWNANRIYGKEKAWDGTYHHPFMDKRTVINREDNGRNDKVVPLASVNIRSCTFTYQSSIELTIAPVRSFLLARARGLDGWQLDLACTGCRAHGIRIRVRTGGTKPSSFSSSGSLDLPILIINFLSFPGRIRGIDRSTDRSPLARTWILKLFISFAIWNCWKLSKD